MSQKNLVDQLLAKAGLTGSFNCVHQYSKPKIEHVYDENVYLHTIKIFTCVNCGAIDSRICEHRFIIVDTETFGYKFPDETSAYIQWCEKCKYCRKLYVGSYRDRHMPSEEDFKILMKYGHWPIMTPKGLCNHNFKLIVNNFYTYEKCRHCGIVKNEHTSADMYKGLKNRWEDEDE